MKALVKAVLRRLAYRLGYHNLDHLTFLLETRLRKRAALEIVQIGANDGKTFDPIHSFVMRNPKRVRGFLLEPVGEYFDELVRTYAHIPSLTPLRLAIHASEQSMDIYRIDPKRLASAPAFTRGIASFDPDYHRKSSTPSDWMIKERVDCISFASLIERYGITKLDLLCIDTEGYDAAIVSAIDFEAIRPVIIVFEHGLRDGVMPQGTFADLVTLLNRHHYDVVVQDYDVVAYQRDLLGH